MSTTIPAAPTKRIQKAGVKFVTTDMPYANHLTIGVRALVAKKEARTKAALAAAKAKGTKLGNPRLLPADAAAAGAQVA